MPPDPLQHCALYAHPQLHATDAAQLPPTLLLDRWICPCAVNQGTMDQYISLLGEVLMEHNKAIANLQFPGRKGQVAIIAGCALLDGYSINHK